METGDHDPEEHRGRYASDYSLVWRASSRLEERTMELHSRHTRGLDPAQAEMALLKRAAQLDLYGLRPQAFKVGDGRTRSEGGRRVERVQNDSRC